MREIKSWMDENRLKMNTSKTKFILFGSRQQFTKTALSLLNVAGETVEGGSFIKYLGAFLDNNLSMEKHVSNICAKATANIVKVKAIRNLLTNETAKTLMVGLVLSHLDANNGTPIELPGTQICRLQLTQNYASKVACKKRKYDSASECLMTLHWLPMKQRIVFKVATLVYKALNNQALDYIKNLFKLKAIDRALRSNSCYKMLEIPDIKKSTFAMWALSVEGLKTWNRLPNMIKMEHTLDSFKAHLKTLLFREAFKLCVIIPAVTLFHQCSNCFSIKLL